MIETSQLQTLVAVTKAKSFSKAAEDLHVTQSAISQSIKNLERKIDVKLFKRSGKKVVLTQEGEKLYALAQNFLSQMEETLDEITDDKTSMSGVVRIGTLTGIGKSWLAPLMLQYGSENKDLTVSINLGFQENLVREFENYRLDFLILPEEALPTLGEKMLIGEETSVLVYPDTPEFNITENTTLEELASYPTILFQEEGDGLYLKWCREKYGQIPKKINRKYVINSHGNMLQAVQKGLGLAVVPLHVLKRSYYKDKVGSLLDFKVSNGKFYVVYHKDAVELTRIRTTLERLTKADNPLSAAE
ncbi:MAG: LysR family transcriptional regulator [Bdellovibrionota bacterium]|jgi:DNA-binding transcriptional LysR family regulator|nr:LysR family transcriptional regulator [Bdellovibrionota bacterium]